MPEIPAGIETIGPIGFALVVIWLLSPAINARLGATKPKSAVEVALERLITLNEKQASNFEANNTLFSDVGNGVDTMIDILKDIKRELERR